MAHVIEHASFIVREGHEQALLDERQEMIGALRRVFPGLVSAWLTRREDGSWLDVILWENYEAAEYSAKHVTEIPEAASWFAHIDKSLGIEHLEVLAADEPDDSRGRIPARRQFARPSELGRANAYWQVPRQPLPMGESLSGISRWIEP